MAAHKYLVGHLVPVNGTEALKWCQRAANQGWHEALSLLTSIYRGVGDVPKDNAEAYYWHLVSKGPKGGLQLKAKEPDFDLTPVQMDEVRQRAGEFKLVKESKPAK